VEAEGAAPYPPPEVEGVSPIGFEAADVADHPPKPQGIVLTASISSILGATSPLRGL